MKVSKNTKVVMMVVAILLGLLFAVYVLNQPIHASIYNYLPYIYGSTFLLVGLYLFLLVFRIYTPKYKTVEQALKVDNLLRTWGNMWKVGSIFMILWGAYNLISHDPNIYRLNSTIEDNRWANKDKAVLIKACLKGAGNTAKKYPEITLDYCTCTTNKIMHSMGTPKVQMSNSFIDDVKKIVALKEKKLER
jgi:hypothetical protein